MNAIEAGRIRYPLETPPEPGKACEIASGLLWIRLPLPMALDHVNVYVLDDGEGWTLVDTGLDTKKTRSLWEGLLAGPLGGKSVRRIIGTHHHPDHIGLAGWFIERGAELWMPRTGWLMARMLTLHVEERPGPEAMRLYRRAGMPQDMLDERAASRPFNLADCVAPIPPGYTRLIDGARICAGGRDWTIRMGGGHAPEHATLWEEEGDLVLGGDQLLPSISPNLGVYANEPDADPVSEWFAACHRLAPHARPEQLVLPGHKLPFYGLPMRLRQLEENHIGALERLRAHLAQPRRACECFLPLFKREIGAGEYGLALAVALAHLNHLFHRGEVTREIAGDGAWLWHIS